MTKSVYLSGPIDGLTYEEGLDWRTQAKERLARLNIMGICPQRGKDYLSQMGMMEFAEQEQTFNKNYPMSTAPAVLARDRHDTLACDAILVNFQGARRVSIGTVMEIAWAHLHHKPVVVVIDKDDNLHGRHPMLRECFDIVVNDLEDGINIIEIMLGAYTGAESKPL